MLSGNLEPERVRDWLILGELSLDGQVRPIRGALSVALHASRKKFSKLLLPVDNTREAAIVGGIEVYPAFTLPQVMHLLNGGRAQYPPVKVNRRDLFKEQTTARPDLIDVKGQETAKRALEVACAGGHNLLMIGPPGAGKTMLAKRIPSILPAMSFAEALTTTAIHSVCGLLKENQPFLTRRPFRAPHHTISSAGMDRTQSSAGGKPGGIPSESARLAVQTTVAWAITLDGENQPHLGHSRALFRAANSPLF